MPGPCQVYPGVDTRMDTRVPYQGAIPRVPYRQFYDFPAKCHCVACSFRPECHEKCIKVRKSAEKSSKTEKSIKGSNLTFRKVSEKCQKVHF